MVEHVVPVHEYEEVVDGELVVLYTVELLELANEELVVDVVG